MIRRFSVVFGALALASVLAMTASPVGASEGGLSSSGSVAAQASNTGARAAATWTITAHSCPNGTAARLTVRQNENGRSGVNYFKQIGQGQVFRNGQWQNRTAPSAIRTTQFPNDLNGHSFTRVWTYSYNDEFNFYHRVLVKLQWWNNNGTPNFFGDDFVAYKATVFNRCPG